MNYCNFAKVILARCTKDTSALNWWKNKDNKENEIQESKPSYDNTIRQKQRHENYMMFMEKYPKMHIAYKVMEKRLSRFQNYLTNAKYWTNCNAESEKSTFIQKFSLNKWVQLSETERKNHQLMDCIPCNTTHIQESSLHKSTPADNLRVKQLCEEVADHLVQNLPKSKKSKQQYGNQAITKILTIMEPIMEEKFDTDFKSVIAKTFNFSPNLSSQEKQKNKKKAIVGSKTEISQLMNNNDTNNILASGKSFSQADRERMATYFINKDEAKLKTETKLEKELNKKQKPKKHHGNFSKYSFNRDLFLQELKSKEPGAIINWTGLARKYNLRLQNTIPQNGGQVMYEFAKSNGINVFKFNKHTRVSGRDYLRRIRRSIKRIGKSQISLPTPRPAKKLKLDIKTMIQSGDINIGHQVVPKTFVKQVISDDGTMDTTSQEIYGRKIPLEDIRDKEIERFYDAGIIRAFTDDEYNNMSIEEVRERFTRIGESCPSTLETAVEKLRQLERTRHLKMWHDHSDILNHSYASFMVSWLYDPANFLTDNEYQRLFPQRKPISIQTFVERPSLYILGQSGSSDKDQMMYNETRLDDIQHLKEPIFINKIPTYDELRIFSGDGPARQFESGQQRGGNFTCLCGVNAENHTNIECCFRHTAMTLDERRQLIMDGSIYLRDKDKTINPLANLRKDELNLELGSRGVGTLGLTRPELQTRLSEILHGIQRPPALMTVHPTKTAEEINCQQYEIMYFEPLHDITNIVQNLIVELPCHLQDAQKDYDILRETTIGDKNQIKGSDARLFAIKLAKFTEQKHAEGKVHRDVLDMVNCLVEIISICYSRENTRSPKQILRLYNQCFLFAVLCVSIIGKPEKMTSRKFYGSHFHTLTTHAPEAARLICLRSVLTENEERSFGNLRRISESTTNRQPGKIVDNAMMRFQAQQISSDKTDSLQQQESIISKQSRLLPKRGGSIFPDSILKKRSSLVQAHMERIADFLVMGEGIWWKFDGDGVIFADGPDDPTHHLEGPSLHHFRSSNLKEEQNCLTNIWNNCIDKFKNKTISLPLKKLRVYENGKISHVQPHQEEGFAGK